MVPRVGSVTRPRQVTLVDEDRPRQGGDPVLPDRLDDGRTAAEPRTLPHGNAQAGRGHERTGGRMQGTPKSREPQGSVRPPGGPGSKPALAGTFADRKMMLYGLEFDLSRAMKTDRLPDHAVVTGQRFPRREVSALLRGRSTGPREQTGRSASACSMRSLTVTVRCSSRQKKQTKVAGAGREGSPQTGVERPTARSGGAASPAASPTTSAPPPPPTERSP